MFLDEFCISKIKKYSKNRVICTKKLSEKCLNMNYQKQDNMKTETW